MYSTELGYDVLNGIYSCFLFIQLYQLVYGKHKNIIIIFISIINHQLLSFHHTTSISDFDD